MPYHKKLVGTRCYLSPPEAEDGNLLTAWLNDLDVTLPLGDEAYAPFSIDNAYDAFRQPADRHEHVFTIVANESDCPIGRCLLFAVDHVNQTALLGIYIGEKSYWGRGYGQDATTLLLDFAFNLLNLHSVGLGVFAFNERALHCYRHVGLRETGRRRQLRLVAGQYYDLILMDILADEFRALHPDSRVVRLSHS